MRRLDTTGHPATATRVLAALVALTASALAALAMPAPTAAQDAAAGQAVFTGKGSCFACHGPQATGTALAPDLTDAEWVNFDARPEAEALERLIREGVASPIRHPAPMPPMGGAQLSDEEIAALAVYVLSLHDDQN